MRAKILLLVSALLALTIGTPRAHAQASAARLLFFNVNFGAKAQFEEALKQQMAARRARNTGWRWLVWEYVTGEAPRYCVATFGHPWSDFDQPAEAAQLEEGRVAAAAALSSRPPVAQFFEHVEEVSDFGSSTNAPTLSEISVYHLHYGKQAQFYSALRDFHDALKQSGNDQRFEWFELRSGGETPEFMLMVPRANWAAFDIDTGEFQQKVEDALGKDKARRVFDEFASAVKTHERTAVRLRADLSLLPAGEP